MGPIEITTIVLVSLFVIWFIGRYIYRKIKHLPTGECEYCATHKGKNALVKQYHKKYGKKSSQCGSSCCCSKDSGDSNKDCSCNQ